MTPISSNKPLTGVLGLFLFLSVYGVWWGLPNFESWSNDDETSLGPLSSAVHGFRAFDKYPPLGYIANAIVYAPYVGYLLISGDLIIGDPDYPHGFSDPIHQLTVMILMSRALSIAGATLTVWLVYRLAVILGLTAGAATLAAALVATSNEVVLFAHTGNVETLLNLFFLLCLVSAARCDAAGRRPFLLIGMWSALSLATKESIWGALIGVAIFVVVDVVRRARWRRSAWWDRRLLLALASFAVTYVCFGTLFAFEVYWERLEHWVEHAGEMAELKASVTQFDVGWRTIREMQLATSPLHLLAFVAGSCLLWRTNRRAICFLAVPVLVYYVTVLAPVKLVWARYTIPIIICGSIAGGAALEALLRHPRIPRPAAAAVIVATLAWGTVRCLASDVLMTRDSRYQAEQWITANIPPDARLEFYGPSAYYPRFRYLGLAANGIPADDQVTESLLKRRNPDYIVVSSNALHSYVPREYFDRLLNGQIDFDLLARIRTSVPFHRNNLFDWDVHSRISPTIFVFGRSDPVQAGNETRDAGTPAGID